MTLKFCNNMCCLFQPSSCLIRLGTSLLNYLVKNSFHCVTKLNFKVCNIFRVVDNILQIVHYVLWIFLYVFIIFVYSCIENTINTFEALYFILSETKKRTIRQKGFILKLFFLGVPRWKIEQTTIIIRIWFFKSQCLTCYVNCV